MGKRDLSLKSYLSDPVRYADVYNGSVFGGVQVLDAAQLERTTTVAVKDDNGVQRETTCDIAMRQKKGGTVFALWILENQDTVDYGMTVRVMLREALEYDQQVRDLKRRNEVLYRRRKDQKSKNGTEYKEEIKAPTAGEYLYKVREGDRICPVCTLIIYWGSEPWKGPRSLHEFLDFSEYDDIVAEELKKLIPEYPLHILDLNEDNDYSGFQTSVRILFELYACRRDKAQFQKYVRDHEECRHLDVETYETIGKLLNLRRLHQIQGEKKEKEEQNMYDVLEEIFQDAKAEAMEAAMEVAMEKAMEAAMEKAMEVAMEKAMETAREEAMEKVMEIAQEKAAETVNIAKAGQLTEIIDSVIEKLHCSLEEACEIAGRSVEEYGQARRLI